jgi:serine protease
MSKKIFKIFSLLLAFVFIVSVAQPAYTSNEGKMRVWVEFSPGRGARVEKSLNALGAEFHYRFEDLNSFVVTVPEQALGGLRNNPNVVSIEEDAIRYPATEVVPPGIDLVQARDVWDTNRDGVVDAGAPSGDDIKVCIIDSGLWTAHEDFEGVNVSGYSSNWNTDTCGHGTHVAGTITASLNELGVVGVNPGGPDSVELYIVKVFDGPECGWTYSSTLANAASQCQAAGANIISMSLGGPTKNKTEERAFNNLYSAGILSIAAAGNEGTSANNYPASYTSVVSVAAIDANKVVADFSQFNSQVELAAPGVGVLSTLPYISENWALVDGVKYAANHVDLSALGATTAPLDDGGLCIDETSDLTGKIALCQRGTTSFLEKVNNATSRHAAGVIIYNNVSGNDLFTLGEGTSDLVVISVSLEDGVFLVENKLEKVTTISANTFYNENGYEAWDGTSMATPHVSGVAALIWSAFPNFSNVQIRNALTGSAMDLGTAGRDVYYGFGLVQAKAALTLLGGGTIPTATPTNPPTATPTTPTPTPPPVTPTPTNPPPSNTLTATVSTDKTTYSNNQRVTITVNVRDGNGVAVSGASVSGQVLNPNNVQVASLNGTTNTSGVATFSYLVKRNVGTGTYTVNATATKSGYTPGSGTITFTVK